MEEAPGGAQPTAFSLTPATTKAESEELSVARPMQGIKSLGINDVAFGRGRGIMIQPAFAQLNESVVFRWETYRQAKTNKKRCRGDYSQQLANF